ncbi:MAG TPA: rRNA maturation RNase YbeY [Gemmatimonadales bacterium]|jgi:probable rRNA maturation factor
MKQDGRTAGRQDGKAETARSMSTGEVVVSGRAALSARATTEAIRSLLRGERRDGFISLHFVGRDRMRELHRRYLGVSRVTDVLAFALRGPDGAVVGDVYVCPWIAAREARRRRVPVREEVLRYVVHGVLHVLGYSHPEDGSRLRSPMWRRQERYVAALR